MSTPLVPDDNNLFYSYPFNPKTHQPDLSKAVASKYLVVNGSKIIDPVAGGSEHLNLYESLNPDGSVNENSRFQNANNYLIVPANYDPSEASTYAKSVNADMTSASRMGPAAGLAVGLADMTKDFWPGGSQDLRRGRNWGIPDNEVASAFKDSASWDFGFTAAPSLIPNVLAEIGGGVLNIFEYVRHPKEHKTPTLPFGMDGADEEDFQAGVQAAEPAGGHGLEAIYNDVLAIGHWLHSSIAPIKGPPTRSSGPRRQAEHASNDDSPAPGLAANSAAHAHSYMATNAPVSSETGVPHALYNYFDRIGEQTLKGGAIETIAPYVGRGKQLGFSVLKVSMDDAETLPTLFAPYLSHLSGLLGPSSSVGKTYSELLHYSPFLEREALPSIAPIGRRGMAEASGERMIARYDEIGEQAARQHSKPDIPAAQKLDPLKLRSALQDLLTQQARLPPSGATAFDPRVTPAWPGLQLPA